MGGSHGAAIVVAVRQDEGVAEFMDRFFQHTLAEQFRVGREPVELLAQAVQRRPPRRGRPSALRRKQRSESECRDRPRQSPALATNLGAHNSACGAGFPRSDTAAALRGRQTRDRAGREAPCRGRGKPLRWRGASPSAARHRHFRSAAGEQLHEAVLSSQFSVSVSPDLTGN